MTHVVFGVGQVGWAVARRLAESGLSVRAVFRTQPADLAPSSAKV